MAKFQCTACNYEFEGSERPPKKCPYCGKFGAVKREKSATEILNEVDYFMKGG
ncbi:MAG: hypothetical protein V1660_03655 [archaeon]